MKGILIDPFTERVVEVSLTEQAQLEEYYLLLDCNTIDVISIPDRGLIETSLQKGKLLGEGYDAPDSRFKNNSLYLDDEGLYKEDQKFYKFIGANLSGRGLILGHDKSTGDAVSTKLSIEDVRPLVDWETEDDILARKLSLHYLTNVGSSSDYH